MEKIADGFVATDDVGNKLFISTETETPEMTEARKKRLRAYYDALMNAKKEKEENE